MPPPLGDTSLRGPRETDCLAVVLRLWNALSACPPTFPISVGIKDSVFHGVFAAALEVSVLQVFYFSTEKWVSLDNKSTSIKRVFFRKNLFYKLILH